MRILRRRRRCYTDPFRRPLIPVTGNVRRHQDGNPIRAVLPGSFNDVARPRLVGRVPYQRILVSGRNILEPSTFQQESNIENARSGSISPRNSTTFVVRPLHLLVLVLVDHSVSPINDHANLRSPVGPVACKRTPSSSTGFTVSCCSGTSTSHRTPLHSVGPCSLGLTSVGHGSFMPKLLRRDTRCSCLPLTFGLLADSSTLCTTGTLTPRPSSLRRWLSLVRSLWTS